MTMPSINSGDRGLLKIVWMLQLATATATADFTAAAVTTSLLNTNGGSSKVTILTGAGITPTNVESELDTEGNKVVQARDIAEAWSIIAQTLTEYKALRALFNGKKCKIIGLVCDPDIAVASATAIVTATAGDILLVSHEFTLDIMSDRRDAAEWKIPLTFSKQIKASLDAWASEDLVVA